MADPTAPHAHAGPHVLPPRVLLGTGAALLALTGTTVALSLVDFGRANIVIALAIATVKAALVALFFMHLKYGKRFLPVVLAGAALFASLMVGFILFDTTEYQPDIRARAAAEAKAAAGQAAEEKAEHDRGHEHEAEHEGR